MRRSAHPLKFDGCTSGCSADAARSATLPACFCHDPGVFAAEKELPNFMMLHARPTSPETCERHVINLCCRRTPTARGQARFDNDAGSAFPQDRAAIERQTLVVDAERSWRREHGTHHFRNLVWRAPGGDARHGEAALREARRGFAS